jgi:PPOX class probable F420-dependent enzyme
MSNDDALAALVITGNQGVLATMKRDGRPQMSVVNYAFDRSTTMVRVSITEGRAKAYNVRRDPRASLHVTSPDGWSWAVAEGTARLSPVATDPHDATVEELIELYRDVQGEHPDWADYRAAMVRDRRIVLRLAVSRFYGSLREA